MIFGVNPFLPTQFTGIPRSPQTQFDESLPENGRPVYNAALHATRPCEARMIEC